MIGQKGLSVKEVEFLAYFKYGETKY